MVRPPLRGLFYIRAMTNDTTAGEIVDALVRQVYGDADQRTQQLFRQNLQVLVELAKCEERREWSVELEVDTSHRGLHTVH